MRIRPFEPADEGQVIDLWRRCNLEVPWNNPQRDIARKLMVNPELFLVGIVVGRIVASVMGGYEGHRGWINYLAVHPDYRERGYGRLIMLAVERKLQELGCPKINLQVRTGNTGVIQFYERIGYTVDPVTSLGKRLVDDPE
ncbi:MAG: GNAT family acetyltransferase [Ardenticatenaceae bacterium]